MLVSRFRYLIINYYDILKALFSELADGAKPNDDDDDHYYYRHDTCVCVCMSFSNKLFIKRYISRFMADAFSGKFCLDVLFELTLIKGRENK